MSLEAETKRVADALEALVALQSGKPAADVKPVKDIPVEADPLTPPATKPEPGATRKPRTAAGPAAPAPEAASVSLEDVTDALREVVQAEAAKTGPKGEPGVPTRAREVLKKYNAAKLSEIKPENYKAVLADLKAILITL